MEFDYSKYDWYRLFNVDDFLATELVSRQLVEVLQDRGRQTFLISRGNLLSITWQGVFLPLEFLDTNPYVDEGMASYVAADRWAWVGFEKPE